MNTVDDQTDADKAFLEAVAKVCREHGKSIAHEDGFGAFVVEGYSESNIQWLMGATGTKPTT